MLVNKLYVRNTILTILIFSSQQIDSVWLLSIQIENIVRFMFLTNYSNLLKYCKTSLKSIISLVNAEMSSIVQLNKYNRYKK